MKTLLLLFAVALLAVSAHAQSAQPAGNVQTFTLEGAPVALPGNKVTFVGSVSGISVQVTKNLSLREDNIVAGSGNMTGFFGGINYTLPAFSTALNNASPNLNGYKFQLYLTGSAGVDRVTDALKNTAQHYAFLAGGGVRYDLTNSGTWSLGVEVRYARLPGFAMNTAIVSAGPALHF